jgi:hypothetical protein
MGHGALVASKGEFGVHFHGIDMGGCTAVRWRVYDSCAAVPGRFFGS